MPEDDGSVECPNCGGGFICGVRSGEEPCWCARLPHVLPCSGSDAACFCPECLSVAVEELTAGDRKTG